MIKDKVLPFSVDVWTKRYKISGLSKPCEDGTFISDKYKLGVDSAVMPLSECPITKGYILECLSDWNIGRLSNKIHLIFHYAGLDVELSTDKPFYLISVMDAEDRFVSYGDKMISPKRNRSWKIESGNRLVLEPHFDYQNPTVYLVCYA